MMDGRFGGDRIYASQRCDAGCSYVLGDVPVETSLGIKAKINDMVKVGINRVEPCNIIASTELKTLPSVEEDWCPTDGKIKNKDLKGCHWLSTSLMPTFTTLLILAFIPKEVSTCLELNFSVSRVLKALSICPFGSQLRQRNFEVDGILPNEFCHLLFLNGYW
ncbi:hypothetical protein VNO77_33923 [Canavalia gladiata]|uniref:Uncharacterized protein n=1 Tax=Canavalia gladiata TaxID=3824 RepID=A0AAN9PYT4_CANGL